MSTITEIVLWIALIGGMLCLLAIALAPFIHSSKTTAQEVRDFGKPNLGLMEQDDDDGNIAIGGRHEQEVDFGKHYGSMDGWS